MEITDTTTAEEVAKALRFSSNLSLLLTRGNYCLPIHMSYYEYNITGPDLDFIEDCIIKLKREAK